MACCIPKQHNFWPIFTIKIYFNYENSIPKPLWLIHNSSYLIQLIHHCLTDEDPSSMGDYHYHDCCEGIGYLTRPLGQRGGLPLFCHNQWKKLAETSAVTYLSQAKRETSIHWSKIRSACEISGGCLPIKNRWDFYRFSRWWFSSSQTVNVDQNGAISSRLTYLSHWFLLPEVLQIFIQILGTATAAEARYLGPVDIWVQSMPLLPEKGHGQWWKNAPFSTLKWWYVKK